MTIEITPLLTVRQFCDKHKGGWPSESALRAIILDVDWGKNNFQAAFKRVGRRVLISEKAFWEAVERMQEDNKNACKQ
jgi:hypothetical protein